MLQKRQSSRPGLFKPLPFILRIFAPWIRKGIEGQSGQSVGANTITTLARSWNTKPKRLGNVVVLHKASNWYGAYLY